MLDGIRVLDLTDERGLMCGRLLADLGADVVQLEPPSGSTARRAEPLGDEQTGSFVWHAYAAGKRSAEIDFDSPDGRELVRALALRADVLVTSWDRAELERLGLSPAELLRSAPGLVAVTVTAFGWEGPKADWAASDLTVWAAGGPLAPHRDGDLPPVGISVPQAYLHAAADAAVGALLALAERDRSGLGQHVDVSAQVSVSQATLSRVLADGVGDEHPEFQQTPTARADRSGSGAATPNAHKKWAVQDGLVELHLSMGAAAGAFTNRLFEWIADAGDLAADLAAWDWRRVPDLLASGDLDPADLDRARAAVRVFLAERTQAEVLQAAMSRRLLCMPILDVAEVAASEHLAAREFFETVDAAGVEARIPAAPAAVRGGPQPRVGRRAPRLGEHTDEVVAEWLGTAPRTDGATAARGLPLRGLRVLDLSWVVAGPLIGRTLADFGADVLRVESSQRIDTARMMQPFHDGRPGPENSALYGNCNAGKRGMTLDLTTADGRRIVHELAARADVLVESFAPGQLAKWGLEPDALRRDHPELIVLSTSIAGQHGPWSTLAGFGNVGSSLSGFQLLVGWPDRLPFGPFGPYTDYLGPRMSLVTLLAALRHRARAGSGCVIDVSQLESGVYFLAPQIARVTRDGVVARRIGNASEQHAPHGVYPAAADRFVSIAATSTAEWLALAETIGRADLAERDDLGDAAGRLAARPELDSAVAAWAADRDAEDLVHRLQAAGVPAHVAQTPADYLRDPQLAHRQHLVRLPHPIHGTTLVEGARIRLADTPGAPRTAAPTLGQHGVEVLRDDLGYDAGTIDRLQRTGVLT